MNTKLIMTLSAIVLISFGITLTFAPDYILQNLNIEVNSASLLLAQVAGGLYFGFGMLNWMIKESPIGGIYNRPIAVANFTHFVIAGLALGKSIVANQGLTIAIYVVGVIYLVFGLLFAILLFRHPIKSEN